MQDAITANRQTKNSVFVGLFSEKRNILQLYKELHPEATDVTVDDITVQTLAAVLANTLYNDLGFLVRNQFVLLLEAQSTWNQNMTLRMLFYISETYKRYLTDSKQSAHAAKRVQLPKPELYIVYTGTQQVPEEISFSEDYFDGDAPVDLRVRILKQPDGATLYGQYIGFCRVFDEQQRIYRNSIRCAEETIRICIEQGYLAAYLEKHKSEVISMLDELFDAKTIMENYETAMQKEYLDRGRAEGRAEGEAKGRAESQLSFALRLIASKLLPEDEIANLTELPLEKIRELAAGNV